MRGKRILRTRIVGLVLLSMSLSGQFFFTVYGDDARAQEIVAKAMKALGGKAKLEQVQSLSVLGKYRRMMQDQERSGELEMDFLLPDKYMKTETMEMLGGTSITLTRTLNSDQTWGDSRSSGPGMVMLRMGDDTEEGRAQMQRQLQAEFARTLFSLLLLSPPSAPVQLAYVGEAEAEDGRADVVEAKGPGGVAFRLFFDQKTHLPLMMSYQGRAVRMRTMTHSAGRAENIQEATKRAEAEAAQAAAAVDRPMDEIQVFFSDYRSVDGILFPHLVTQSVNGQVSEEWEFKSFKVNPPLKPEKFEKK